MNQSIYSSHTPTVFDNETDKRPVLVSICCITFNHVQYIRDALEGFINQKTNFRYEVIVHDDASTDGTTEIILEYASKYPNIIKPIIEQYNQYSKGNQIFYNRFRPHLKGKYIAECEGDDYWIDPNKLQKQVDFLENNEEYSLCFHNAIVKFTYGAYPDKEFAKLETRDYTEPELINHWIAPTASFLYRKEVAESRYLKEAFSSNALLAGDLPILVSACRIGKIKCFNDCMSVYRKSTNGAIIQMYSKRYSKDFRKKEIYSIIELIKIFGEPYGPTFSLYFHRELPIVYKLLLHGDFANSYRIIRFAYKFLPPTYLLRLFSYYPKVLLHKIKL